MTQINLDRTLDSSISQMVEIERHGNFRTVKNEFGELRLKKLLPTFYPKYTVKEIEKITGIPDSTLSRWFRIFGIPFKEERNSKTDIIFKKVKL